MMKILFLFLLVAQSMLASNVYAQNTKPFEVIAYYSGEGNNLQDYDFGSITQIIYSFLYLNGDTLHFASEAKKEGLRKVVALKKTYPTLKVLVSLGGWGGCNTCSPVFMQAESRKNFAASVARLMQEYDVDGIDLDWEYPTIPGPPDHPFNPEDKNNFTDLIVQIRKAIGNEGQLSFAAGGFTKFLEESVDWQAIMPHLDLVNLMTYDLIHGYSKETGHHTALHSTPNQKESTDNCVQWLLKHNVPAEKLIIGAAFYARIFENVSNKDWGLYKAGSFKESLDFKNFGRLEPDSGWVHHWDMEAMAPYAFHRTKNYFATYDNAMSLYEKVLYARKYKLGGIMFWELQCDATEGGLLQSLAESVKQTEPHQ